MLASSNGQAYMYKYKHGRLVVGGGAVQVAGGRRDAADPTADLSLALLM